VRGQTHLAVAAPDKQEVWGHGRTDGVFTQRGMTRCGASPIRPSPQHIVPGHDPLVMKRYPAVSAELEGIAVRLDVAPASY
jgi:hypothetical protein